MRYVVFNPVRASMVVHSGDYQWSSYVNNAIGKISALTQHILYEQPGSNKLERQFSYRELFRHHLDIAELHSIREALNQEILLGRDNFKEKIEQMTKREVKPAPMG